jgi:hypothetical protein
MGVTLCFCRVARCGHRFSRPQLAPGIARPAVLNRIAVATTETMLRANAAAYRGARSWLRQRGRACGTGLAGWRGGRNLDSYSN